MQTETLKPFPILPLDDQYYLREHCLEDAAAFFKYYADPEVSRFILASPPTTLAEAEAEILYCRNLYYKGQGIYWSIARLDNNEMIGAIGCHIHFAHKRAEICYDLGKKYWQQGITKKAILAVKNYLFAKRGFHRVEAITLSDNPASVRVLKATGFLYEGTLRNYKYFSGKPYDVEIYSCVN